MAGETRRGAKPRSVTAAEIAGGTTQYACVVYAWYVWYYAWRAWVLCVQSKFSPVLLAAGYAGRAILSESLPCLQRGERQAGWGGKDRQEETSTERNTRTESWGLQLVWEGFGQCGSARLGEPLQSRNEQESIEGPA